MTKMKLKTANDVADGYTVLVAMMGGAMRWFDANKVSYTGADLIEATKVMLKYERDIEDADKRRLWERKIGMEEPA